ncbi:hypothetical protein D3C72_1789170 [compost metagenome]
MRPGDKGAHLGLELLVSGVARALQPELEAARGAQARDRGRVDRDHHAVLVLRELLLGVSDQVGRALARAALVEALERNEDRAGIGLVLRVDQAVAGRRRHGGHAGLPGEPVAGTVGQRLGAVQAGRIGHDHRAQDVALVLHRQER